MKISKLRKNVIASYVSQLYSVLAGILLLPFYITELGPEAYGLVGFFAMLQSIFSLLDIGLTPTISRETARYKAGVLSDLLFSQLIRTLHLIFISISIIGGGLLFCYSEIIAINWLNVENLVTSEVVFSLKLMALSVSLRWVTGLYRGVVTGCEEIVWLSWYNITFVTLRYLIIFPVMWFFGSNLTVFFTYQFIVAFLEFCGLLVKSKKLSPVLSSEQIELLVWSIRPIKPYLSFAMSIAFTSGLWVIVTQTDKLIMSKLLPLNDYGYFTLAVLVASGIMMIAGPISNSILPRMAKLEAEGSRAELLLVYSNSTQLISVVAGSISIMLVIFSSEVLFVWTGNRLIVDSTAGILQFYSAGYGLLVIGAFPYYIQYALGKLKLHLIGSVIFVVILLPTLWSFTSKFGVLGAGYAWFLVNLTYFVFWTPVVHRAYVPGFHFKWVFNDIIRVVLFPIIVALTLKPYISESSRGAMLVELILIGIVVLLIAALNSRILREIIFNKISRKV